MKAKIFSILFVAILLLQVASAEIVVNKLVCNFDMSSSHIDRKVCAGSETIVPVTIDNVGDVEALFDLEVISKQEDWFALSKQGVLLKPSESEKVFMRVNIPFDFTGMVDYTVKATTREFGREKFLHRSFEVVNCQNINVEGPGSDVICPAELSTTSFVVSNPAPFADHYILSVDEFADHVTLSERAFTLAPGEEKEVFVYTKFSPEMYGDFSVPVSIQTESNEMVKELSVNINVKKAYDFGVEVDSYAFACGLVERTIPIVISNNEVSCEQHNGIPNVYDLSFVGAPDFVELSHDAVTLVPGESITVFATVNAHDVFGTFDTELVVKSRLGDLVATRQVKIEVGDCYNHDLEMPEDALIVCGEGELGTEVFDVNVRNKGLYEEDVALTLVAEGWAELDQRRVHLAKDENANVGLVVNPPCTDETYTLKTKSQDVVVPEVQDKDEMELRVVTPRTAFGIEVLQHNFDVEFNENTLEVPVKHVGVQESTYEVSIASMFLTPEENILSLEPGEVKNVVFRVGDVKGLEPGEYLHDLLFIEQSKGLEYSTGIGTNLIGPSFIQRAWSFLMNKLVHSKWYSKLGWCGWSGILLVLVLIGLLQFGNMCRNGSVRTKRFTKNYRTNFRILNLGLVLLAVVAIVYSVTTFDTARPEFFVEAPVSNDLLTIQFGEDTTERLNLDRFFVDPDNDKLVYNSLGTEHVEVLINENIASLTPDEGWFGVEKTAFTATDQAGAQATSKVFTLEVLERKNLSWWNYWLANCSQVNAFIIGLIFLSLLLIVGTVAPLGEAELQERRDKAAATRAKNEAAKRREAAKRARVRAERAAARKRSLAAKKAAATRRRNARRRR